MPQLAKRRSRATAIALAGALHGLIFTLLIRGGHERLAGADGPAESTLVFFDIAPQQAGPETTKTRTAPNHALRTRAISSTASTATQSLSPDSTAPVAVDWDKEAAVAAGHQIGDEERARLARSAPAPDRYRPEPPPAAPPFGWDYAATHRIAALAGGGLVINVSDRCAITIVFPAVLGGCRIGKIEARGDLFAHMYDQPSGEGASSSR